MTARRAWWTPFGLALLCAHCTVGAGLAALGALGLVTLPTVGGVPVGWAVPPALAVSAFGWWLWSGRERAEAHCAVPAPPVTPRER